MKILDWRDENYMMACSKSWDGALPVNHQINLTPLNNVGENEGESTEGEDQCASRYYYGISWLILPLNEMFNIQIDPDKNHILTQVWNPHKTKYSWIFWISFCGYRSDQIKF